MNLNGVKILRIADLKRFFDLRQFWKARAEYVDIVKNIGADIAFDKKDEILLYRCLEPWLTNGTNPNAAIRNGKLIVRDNGVDHSFTLGNRLSEKYNLAISNKWLFEEKDTLGLTILYVLLGTNTEGNPIALQYEDFATIKADMHTGEVREIDKDVILKPTVIREGNLVEWRVIVNKGEKQIKVVLGNDSYMLEHGDCIIGLFPRINGGDECWKLLPNVVSDEEFHLSLRLRFNSNTMRPKMEKTFQGGVSYEEDVYFIHIENGLHPVYLTIDGELHGTDDCFQLNKAYRKVSKKLQQMGQKLLAIYATNGSHMFFTDHGNILKL